MVCEIQPGGYYGYGGPRNGQPPDLPLVYLPRGLDNSSGGQTYISSDRWGPLKGQMLHFSYGAGTSFLLLRESGRRPAAGGGRPAPRRVRLGVAPGPVQPEGRPALRLRAWAAGGRTPSPTAASSASATRATPCSSPSPSTPTRTASCSPSPARSTGRSPSTSKNQFAQCWNYRYGAGYGSPELSPRHPGMSGHDPLAVRSATVLADGRTLFLEIPDLQPVNQLHLHLRVDSGLAHRPVRHGPQARRALHRVPRLPALADPKVIAAHPILSDLAALDPGRARTPGAVGSPAPAPITIEAGKNLTFSVPSFKARPGEPIKLTFVNPDVVPHNWVLIKPGTLPQVGDLVNKIIAEPDAVARHYVPGVEATSSPTPTWFTRTTRCRSISAPRAGQAATRISAPSRGTGW